MTRPAVSNHRVRRFIAAWDLPFAVATVLLYGATIPLLVIAFPDVSNLWLSVFVLIGGLTASISSLATLLKEDDTHDQDTG